MGPRWAGRTYAVAKAHCCVAVDESRSSLAARCVSFSKLPACLSVYLWAGVDGWGGDKQRTSLRARAGRLLRGRASEMEPITTAGTGLEEKAFETVRRSLDVHARMIKAQEGKVEANSFFAAGDWRSSVISYLTCIWFLQRGNQPCPSAIVSQTDSLDGVSAALGDGASEEEEERGAEERQALRVTLHLNLAAAALKLKEWEIARIACEFVFSALGYTAPSKAFYRLAKAHEGEGSLPEAIALLEHLLTNEPGNMEAALLCDALRKRQKTADAKLQTPKVEDLRQRVEAAGAAARPAMDLEKMSAADFGRLSQEEQERMVDAINSGIDAEDDSVAAQGEFDTAELQRALGESR